MAGSSPAVTGLIQIVEPAVPNALFRRAHRALRRVGNAATYWRTFWFDFHDPQNVVEELALSLRSHLPRGAKIAGVEWWIGRMRTTNVPLEFHHDRDLALYESIGRVVHPSLSSVLFFNTVRGGSLLVTNQTLVTKKGWRLQPASATHYASVRPLPNRFALFSGALYHGVLDANDELPHGRLSGKPASVRWSIVFNWWKRAPINTRRWSESRAYRALKSD